jgi:hypothetical protein
VELNGTEYGPIAFDLIGQKDIKAAKAAKTTTVKRSELDQQLLPNQSGFYLCGLCDLVVNYSGV